MVISSALGAIISPICVHSVKESNIARAFFYFQQSFHLIVRKFESDKTS